MDTDLILSNQVICKLCGDAPYSTHRHDYKTCKCGEVGVDGGMDYLRRVGNSANYKDISIEWKMDYYTKIADLLNCCYIDGSELLISQQTAVDKIVSLYIEAASLGDHLEEPLRRATEWSYRTGRNSYGLICALARTERDGDFYEGS